VHLQFFFIGDARETQFNTNNFDFVLNLGNSFGYYKKDAQNIQILQEVYRILSPGGIFLIDFSDRKTVMNNLSAEEMTWLDHDHFIYYNRFFSDDGKMLYTRELIVHKKKGLIKEYCKYKKLYSSKEIVQLLEQTGFHNITLSGELNITSQENKHIGMMGNRIIVCATACKKI